MSTLEATVALAGLTAGVIIVIAIIAAVVILVR
jgi:hypothetical protein